MPVDYLEIMQELNQEYEKVLERAEKLKEQNQIDSRLGYFEEAADKLQSVRPSSEDMWREVVNVAIDITGDDSFRVSQAGDFQFWRDKTELAVVDAKTQTLVVYADTRGIVPQKVPDNKLPSTKDTNNLLGKIAQNNPTVVFETNDSVLEKAYDFIKPLDPVSRVDKVEQRGWDLDRALGLVDKTIDSAILALSNIKQKCRNIANNIAANKLMKSAASKFEEAWQKTEESDYDIGDYRVSKTDDIYQVKDLNDNPILSYKKEDGQLKVTEVFGDRQMLEEAISQIDQSPAIGDANKTYQYNFQISQMIKRLSEYPNGKHELGEGNLLVKQNDSVKIKDADGRNLLLRDGDKKTTNISKAQIGQVNRAAVSFLNEREQDRRVEVAAAALAKILNNKKTIKIDRPKASCEFNPETNVLKYLDRQTGETFEAKRKLGGKWENIRGKSNISREKVAALKKGAEASENNRSRQEEYRQQTKKRKVMR